MDSPNRSLETRQGIGARLLRSHLQVAALGVVLLIVALATTIWLRSNVRALSEVRAPALQASTMALSGVQHSLATLRGWVALADPDFREDRNHAWEGEIEPAMLSLKSLSSEWDEKDRKLLTEAVETLMELKEWQWWIEDVANTPGNEPSRVLLMEELQPLAREIRQTVSGLIDEEKTLGGSSALLVVLADFRGVFLASETELTNYVADAGAEYKMGFEVSVGLAGDRLDQVDSFRKMLTRSQFDRLTWLRNEFDVYCRMAQQIIEMRESSRWNISQYLMTNKAVPLARKSIDMLSAMTSDQDRLMQEDARWANSVSNLALVLLFSVIALMIITSWVLSRRSSERITRPIETLSTATLDFASGQLIKDIPVDGDDEIADLTLSFNAMRADIQRAEEELKKYAQQAETRSEELQRLTEASQARAMEESRLAELSSQLHGNLTVAEVAGRTLSSIAEFIGAPSGALYVLDGDNRLHRAGAYALSPDAESLTSFAFGTGSVGQAARSRQLSVQTPPPETNGITFGFATATPCQIVTSPLVSNDELAGVVELLLLEAITEEQIRWLGKACEIAATSLRFAHESRS